MRQYERYKCNKCGNEVEVQTVGGDALNCCGESMEMELCGMCIMVNKR